MPIRPKGGAEWALQALTGTQGLKNRIAVVGAEHEMASRDRRDALFGRGDARAEAQAAREQEAHTLEIERAKRKAAEEEAKALREDQERIAQKEAGRFALDRLRQGAASEGPGTDGLDDNERAVLDRAESLRQGMSAAAFERFVSGEVGPMLQSQRLARSKDATADRAGDTIKNISTADFDTTPLVAEIQGGMDLLNQAETPEQVIAATKAITSATATATKTVHEESVKEDVKQHGMALVQEIFAGDPAKIKTQSWIVRAIQYGIIAAQKGIEMAVTDKYGLKPPTGQDIAAKGGPMQALYTTPQGKQANAVMGTEATSRTWKEVAAMLLRTATYEERMAAFKEQFPKNLAIVHAENGWFAPEPPQNQPGTQPIDPNRDANMRPEWRRPSSTSTDASRSKAPAGPAVPLEAVREAMGSQPQGQAAAQPGAAQGAKDDPEQTKAAVAAEMVKRAKERGWSKEQARAEYEKAISEMGLGGVK